MLLVMYGQPSPHINRSPHLGLMAWRSREAADAWSQPLHLPAGCLLQSSEGRKELLPHDGDGVPVSVQDAGL